MRCVICNEVFKTGLRDIVFVEQTSLQRLTKGQYEPDHEVRRILGKPINAIVCKRCYGEISSLKPAEKPESNDYVPDW